MAVVLRLLCIGGLKWTSFFQTATPALLTLAFLSYPLVTMRAFEAFSCYTFTTSEWLKAEYATLRTMSLVLTLLVAHVRLTHTLTMPAC